MLFISEFKGSPINIQEFERLIDVFERENAEEETVKPFSCFVLKVEGIVSKQAADLVDKVYEVSPKLKAVVLEAATDQPRR